MDSIRWQRYIDSLRNRAGLTEEILSRAREIAKRAAALDTGAIEGLYEVDRGFTYTVAFETSAWEAALAMKGERVRSLFEAQLHAYDYVLDLATKAEPISEAAVRALHAEVCRAQSTYLVMTAIGPQEQPLPKGQYKTLPNHVRTRKGTDHSYAPVDVTPAEMARLVAELRSAAFIEAHPVLQAAYAHYVFYIGRGDRFDDDKLEAYPPGSVIILPGNTDHFHWAKSGEYVTQVTAIGPLSLEYVHINDDPRNKHSLEDVE